MDREKLQQFIALQRRHVEPMKTLEKYFQENIFTDMVYETYALIEQWFNIDDDESWAIFYHIHHPEDSDFKTDEELIDWLMLKKLDTVEET